MKNIKYPLLFLIIIFNLGLFFTQKTYAASLGSVSDIVSTSRPSASAPLNTNQAASATQISVVDNGSIYLAGDQATIFADAGEVTNSLINVASMSAQIAGSPNTRNVYLTSTIPNLHHLGDAFIVNTTATHTVRFTATTSIPTGGKIIITFPGAGSTIASPSATGFSFNGEIAVPTDVFCNPTTACNNGVNVAMTGNNTFTLTTTGPINGGTVVSVLIGCTTQVAGTCTVFRPRLINPTKTAAAGTADTWKITITTTDAGNIVLDTSKALVGTIEAVQVQATVEPYMTFTIAGIANGGAACSDITNPGVGFDATATFVNLGGLASGTIDISAQNLVVSTNGAGGYTLSSTSSGKFINPSTGFSIADANGGNGLTAIDTPAPAVFPAAGNPAYGIHPCAAGSTSIPTVSAIWASGATAFTSGAKYSNPWNTGTNGFYANISSFNGPSTNSTTTVEYAATVSPVTPAGIYSNIFTYVATPIF